MLKWNIDESKTLKYCAEGEKARLKEDYLIDIDKCVKQYELTKRKSFDVDSLRKVILEECYNYFPTQKLQKETSMDIKEFPITDAALSICATEYCLMSTFIMAIMNIENSNESLGFEKYEGKITDGKISLYSMIDRIDQMYADVEKTNKNIIRKKTVEKNKNSFCQSEFGFNLWKKVGGSTQDVESFSQTGGYDVIYDMLYSFSIWKWADNPYNDVLSAESDEFYNNDALNVKELDKFFRQNSKSIDSKYSYSTISQNHTDFQNYLNIVRAPEGKRIIDEWFYNLIYHYDYILKTHAYLENHIKFTMIKKSPLVILDEHESKKRVLQFLLGRLSIIPAPYSRVYIAQNLIDSYVSNSETFSEDFIINDIEEYIKKFMYVTMEVFERAFFVSLYEINMKEKSFESESDYFKMQIDCIAQELAVLKNQYDDPSYYLEKLEYPASKKSDLSQEVGGLLLSCCYFYHEHYAYYLPMYIDISEKEREEIDKLLAKKFRNSEMLDSCNLDNSYLKRYIQATINEKLYDSAVLKWSKDREDIKAKRRTLIKQYLSKNK